MIVKILLAAVAGLAHGQEFINLTPAIIFPLVWLCSDTRLKAFVLALTYYIFASRGLYLSAPVFFGEGSKVASIFLWWGSAISLSLPWALLYGSTEQHGTISTNRSALNIISHIFGRLLLIAVLLTVPPLGYWGWANPLVAAGNLFPGTGYIGFLLLILAWSFTGYVIIKKNNIAAVTLIGGVLLAQGLIFVPLIYGDAQPAPGWTGIQTKFDRLASGSDDSIGEYDRYRWLQDKIYTTKGKYIVLPETVAGKWSDTTEQIWQPLTDIFAAQGRTYLVGGEVQQIGSYKYYNVVKIRGVNNDEIKQRMPVPYSMWRPWNKHFGAIPAWTEKRIVEIDQQKVAILICYEPYLMFPPLVSFSAFPDILVCVSNSWWSKNSSLPALSDQNVKSWSLLFGVPYVISKNL